jgi:hypothetical protein
MASLKRAGHGRPLTIAIVAVLVVFQGLMVPALAGRPLVEKKQTDTPDQVGTFFLLLCTLFISVS